MLALFKPKVVRLSLTFNKMELPLLGTQSALATMWQMRRLETSGGLKMLRVEFHERANELTFRLEGPFVGTFAEEVKSLVARCGISARLVLDLTQVTCLDVTGEEVLKWLFSIHATFLAGNGYSRRICNRLRLPFYERSFHRSERRIRKLSTNNTDGFDLRTAAICNGIHPNRKNAE
jgi:hypothetical protein